MDGYTQERRRLRIDTVLGQDHVLLVSLRGSDSISSHFTYDLELASTDHAIQAGDMLGTPATFRLDDGTDHHATINGIVSRFAASGRDMRGFSLYRIRVVPSLWFLTRTSDCRIFQEKTVRDIVDTLLAEYGIQHREWRLNAEHEKHEYCVQYRETAYDFICRLLEEEGIFFYFRHDEKNHTVVFSDHNRGLTKCANTQVAISPDVGAPGGIWQWEHGYRFRSGRWALGDYNFETPSTSLTTEKRTVNPVLAKRPFEMFDYPGRYLKKGPGDALAKLRIEYEEAAYQEIAGEGACVGFAAGTYFSLSNADAREADKEYLITSVEHFADDWSQVTQDAKPATYSNRFRCALALGAVPAGDEDHAATHPRHADRGRHRARAARRSSPTSTAASRCSSTGTGRARRTSTVPAGCGWRRAGRDAASARGTCRASARRSWSPSRRAIPTGRWSSAPSTMPSRRCRSALPANKTQSGLRTRSSMGGGAANCNEFRFEDRKGSELVSLHAEKDLSTEIEHDATHWVGHDETTTVDNNRTETVHGNETITIDRNRTETVHMNETVNVDMNRAHTIMLNEALTVGMARVHTVGAAEAITVGAARTVTVGAAQAITVGADQAITVGANQTIAVAKDQSISVGANETTSIAKDRSANVGENETLEVGKKIMIIGRRRDRAEDRFGHDHDEEERRHHDRRQTDHHQGVRRCHH